MHYILAAILSNLSYAILDNINGVLSKRNKPLQIAFWGNLFGSIIFLGPLLLYFKDDLVGLRLSQFLFICLLSMVLNLGFLAFITAMHRGSVTLAGVVGGSFPAVTTIIAIIFLNERVIPLQLLCVALILFAVALSSISGKMSDISRDIKKSGTIFALIAFFAWGIYFSFIDIAVEQVGWFIPIYISNVFGVILFGLIALKTKNIQTYKLPSPVVLAVCSSVIGVSGSLFFNYAISKGPTSIVAPIAGSSPAIFVIIAYFIFKEKLNKKQWTGIALAIAGIVSLSLLSS